MIFLSKTLKISMMTVISIFGCAVKIDYDKVIRGKTLKEWQKYNTEINKKYIRGYNGL